MSTQKKGTRRDRLRQFVNGMKLHLASQKTVTINNVVRQVDDIITEVEADIATSDSAEKGHASWLQLVDEERASHTAIDPTISAVEKIVRVQFGDGEGAQGVLGDFGLAVHKKKAVTPKVKVAAADKAKATRTLLHTAGPKQKAAVKAQAAATTVAPEPPAAPAPAAGGPTTPAKQ